MSLSGERASNQVGFGKASWNGAKERHPSIVNDPGYLEGRVGKCLC